MIKFMILLFPLALLGPSCLGFGYAKSILGGEPEVGCIFLIVSALASLVRAEFLQAKLYRKVFEHLYSAKR